MTDPARLYLAGCGMITPVGAHTAMTAAAVRAEMSGYRASRFFTRRTRQPITLARVPKEVFNFEEYGFDNGGYHNVVTIMAILALREALGGRPVAKPLPLILCVPEPGTASFDAGLVIEGLCRQRELPLHPDLVRRFDSGRAAGIEGLTLARHLLLTQPQLDFVLLGGADSHADPRRLEALEKADRLLTPEAKVGFVPGEGAGFLLLTRHPGLALNRNGRLIALGAPGVAEEPGHLSSNEPYRGDGLDRAFKQALADPPAVPIGTVYSSMNGEHYWAKEYGVAYTRNSEHFEERVKIEHPADCFGDLGAATGPVLLGLAAEHLWKQKPLSPCLVYASADGPVRAAVRMETQPQTAGANA